MEIHRVLVSGIGGNIGQGVLKALRAGKRKYYIVGIDMEQLSAGFSLVDKAYAVPKTGSPDFLEKITSIIKREEIEAVYVNSPSELSFFSINAPRLETELNVSIFVNPEEVVKLGSDKFYTAEFLRKNNFPYISTCLGDNSPGIEDLKKRHGFPLLAKPRFGFTSENVFLVNSDEEIHAVNTLFTDMVFQQYIPDASTEYTATTISDKMKKVRAHVILHRYLVQGTTYRTELLQDEMVSEQIIKIADSLGTIGSCNFQFRLFKGKAFVFEINPRFSGTGGIRYLNGFNDAEMVFELLRLGLTIKQPQLQPAVVLRYWNEIYFPGMTFESLSNNVNQHIGIQIFLDNFREIPQTLGKHSDVLDSMADRYFTPKSLGPDRKQMNFIMDAVLPHCRGPRVLELGYGNGAWTERLVESGFDVTVVEGSQVLVDQCKTRFSNRLIVVHSLFEDFLPEKPFETIIASCVLEHLKDYRSFLDRVSSWLVPNGDLHIVVPNALSLHRRVGLQMGMLKDPFELSPQEIEVGHHHAFSASTISEELAKKNLAVNFLRGVFLKPLSSHQMLDWPENLMVAFNKVGEELEDYCAFIYVNCSPIEPREVT